MYINPFVAGCIVTLLGEWIGLVIYSFVKIRRANRDSRYDDDEE